MERLGLRILVIEDNLLEADLMKQVLHAAGCSVVGPTARPEQALALARQNALDGAFLDIHLAGLNSFATAWELKRRGVPFAFVSGYPRSYVPGPGPLRDAPFLAKPFDRRELVATLSSFAPRAPSEPPKAPKPDKPQRRMKQRQLNL